MGYTKEQRIINSVSGSTKAQRNEKTPFSHTGSFNIPNKSGELRRSFVRGTPTENLDIVNKEYVDNNRYTDAEAVAAVEAAGYFKDQTDVDHNSITNTHNLTTDIDHNSITNTHNLTTDINHDNLTGFVANEHLDWTQDLGATNINNANITSLPMANTAFVAGTNCTLSTNTLNVDDAFIKNDADDTSTGKITAANFAVTGDNNTNDSEYVPMVLHGTDATPPTASNFPKGTIYIQYTI